MTYVEITMVQVQVQEVLRRWLRGDAGVRVIAQGAGVDRKTAQRYIDAAQELGPANALHVTTVVARRGRRKEPIGFDHRGPVPGARVAKCTTDLSEGCVRETPPTRTRAGETSLLQQ